METFEQTEEKLRGGQVNAGGCRENLSRARHCESSWGPVKSWRQLESDLQYLNADRTGVVFYLTVYAGMLGYRALQIRVPGTNLP